jgi:peroxiredoxin
MRFIPVVSALMLAAALHADAPNTPRHAPEFVLTFNDGSQKLLSSYRGKAVMVAFVRTDCPHCQHACQVFSKLNTEYASKGFQPIAVAWNEMSKMLVPDFVKANGVNFPVAYSERDKVLEFLQFSPIVRTMVPQIVWIDRKGMIRAQTAPEPDPKMLQEDYWRQMIETLTSEGDSGVKKTTHATTRKTLR